MRAVVGLCAALSFAVLAPAPIALTPAAAADAADDGKRKINLAGRQRMLSQRMAKSICFAAIGVEADANLAMAADAHALFDRTLAGLRDGDAEQGLAPETYPAVLTDLEGVEALWADYGAAVAEVVSAGAVSEAAFASIAALNVPVLAQMHRTVGQFERRYGATGDIHPMLALAINVSGRQRMLTQRASKEFCLIVAGHEAAENREALAETVALFDRSLNGLIDGDDDMGLVEAPTDALYDQLEKVRAMWTPLKAIFEATAAGETPTDADVARVAEENNPLLVEMNRAVGLYEAL